MRWRWPPHRSQPARTASSPNRRKPSRPSGVRSGASCKRRNDLIPSLVDGVKGYAPNEQPVVQAVADSHGRLAAARTPEETFVAANQQSTALARLLADVGNDPRLKANESFNRLMDELKGTENGIAIERMRYNALVQQYMTNRRPLGGALIAGLFRFRDYPFFEVPPASKFPKVEIPKEQQP